MAEDKKAAYLLRSIPGDLYKTVRMICLERNITFREAVISSLKDYCTAYLIERRSKRGA